MRLLQQHFNCLRIIINGRLAEKLWYLYHDFSEEAREAGYLSCLSEIRGNGFPEETRRLTEQLNDPAFRQTLKEEYAAFWTAYQQDRDLLRFHYHRPREIWENLKDLDLPRRTFSSDLSQVPTVQHFITEDEIDAEMCIRDSLCRVPAGPFSL